MTYKENIAAILEYYFVGFKEEIINSACNRILELEPNGDCISREALDDAISDLTYWHFENDKLIIGGGGSKTETVYKVDDVWRLTHILPPITPKTEWIPISERLPETDGVYTVTRRLFDNQINTEPYYMVDACYFDGSNTWHDDNRINHGRHLLEDIIAWMPLPEEPYKTESEDKI